MQLRQVDNYTPFEWFAFEKMAPGQQMRDVLIVKAACQVALRGDRYVFESVPAGDPPIHMSDAPHDYDGGPYASLRATGDTVLCKPGTDFLLTGSALPPDGPSDGWGAEIWLDVHRKQHRQTLALHGERHWQYSLLSGWSLSDPEPCECIDLRYELAYGGSYPEKDTWNRYPNNPVGRGHLPLRRMDKEVYYPAARIELLGNRLKAVDKPIAVPALGPIPRTWPSRKKYAGTYDQQWRANAKIHPDDTDYPSDFDTRFFQAAHPDWIFQPYWTGNETIGLAGFTGNKVIDGKLPGWQVIITVPGPQGAAKSLPMHLDTVELNLDHMRLYLVWRMSIDQSHQIQTASVHLQQSAQTKGAKNVHP